MHDRICRILIPDTGPLISLARGDLLWTLPILEKEIVLPLAVKYEFEGHITDAKNTSCERQANDIMTCLEACGALWLNTPSSVMLGNAAIELAILRDRLVEVPHKTQQIQTQIRRVKNSVRHAGEAGIVEIIRYLYSQKRLSAPAMILYEDKSIPLLRGTVPNFNEDLRILPDTHVHLVGTRGFLVGLAQMNIIEDAELALQAIEKLDADGIARHVADNKDFEDVPAVGGSAWTYPV